ncbi:hypothetical protein LENED_009152 [Lentinula edodes]|uniref:Uncharacterized protein n=1 Tax=Lentinula edodes TaxID=5353 RepID=A0A1Q3EIX8_LENED|nr:hypothetical protein LENED_009152 [Lentinula edodes]
MIPFLCALPALEIAYDPGQGTTGSSIRYKLYHRPRLNANANMKLTYTLAILLSAISVARATFFCAVCPATIVHNGITTAFLHATEEEENTVECVYLESDNDIPICDYFNSDGVLLIGTTGAACPSTVPLNAFAGTGTCIAADSQPV